MIPDDVCAVAQHEASGKSCCRATIRDTCRGHRLYIDEFALPGGGQHTRESCIVRALAGGDRLLPVRTQFPAVVALAASRGTGQPTDAPARPAHHMVDLRAFVSIVNVHRTRLNSARRRRAAGELISAVYPARRPRVGTHAHRQGALGQPGNRLRRRHADLATGCGRVEWCNSAGSGGRRVLGDRSGHDQSTRIDRAPATDVVLVSPRLVTSDRARLVRPVASPEPQWLDLPRGPGDRHGACPDPDYPRLHDRVARAARPIQLFGRGVFRVDWLGHLARGAQLAHHRWHLAGQRRWCCLNRPAW